MKKVIFLFVAMFCVATIYASDLPLIPNNENIQKVAVIQEVTGYLKAEDKMFVLKGEEMSEMEEDVTLENGTVVTKEGIVKPVEGETIALENGQYVDLEGNIKKWKEDKQ